MRPGDLAWVWNPATQRSSAAIIGDVGPRRHLGEGSLELARRLDLPANARRGGAPRGIVYVLFPGSGDRRPKAANVIDEQVTALVRGLKRECLNLEE